MCLFCFVFCLFVCLSFLRCFVLILFGLVGGGGVVFLFFCLFVFGWLVAVGFLFVSSFSFFFFFFFGGGGGGGGVLGSFLLLVKVCKYVSVPQVTKTLHGRDAI